MKKTPLFSRTKWLIDPSRSYIGFKTRHLKFANIRGMFKEFDANIYTTGDDFLTAKIDFWLNPDSIDTGDDERDIQLKSPGFLEVNKFTVIHFCATSYVRTVSDERFEMHGELTIVGVSRVIKLDVVFGGIVKDTFGNERSLFNVRGSIRRKDWGLNWNARLEPIGVLISEDVWIECNVELIKQA